MSAYACSLSCCYGFSKYIFCKYYYFVPSLTKTVRVLSVKTANVEGEGGGLFRIISNYHHVISQPTWEEEMSQGLFDDEKEENENNSSDEEQGEDYVKSVQPLNRKTKQQKRKEKHEKEQVCALRFAIIFSCPFDKTKSAIVMKIDKTWKFW